MYFQTRALTGPDTGNSRITDLYQLNPDRYPYILSSTAAGHNGRFDILIAHPQQTLELKYSELEHASSGFIDALYDWWQKEKIDTVNTDDNVAAAGSSDSLPFTGGWFVYLSYELAAEIEPVLDLPAGDRNDPVALAVRCPSAVIYDHQRNKHTAVAEREFSYLLDTIEQDFNRAVEAIHTCLLYTSDAADDCFWV